jgi:hypothetical protein
LKFYKIKRLKIFTFDKDLLDINDNFILTPIGGCWIEEKDRIIHEKNKNISMILSSKINTSGHKLRHKVIKSIGNIIDVYGNGYNSISYKLESLQNYKYQIVIENVKKDFWFTEKLIDCFVTGTIPIYYGCPSIHNFFDINGIITFDTVEELIEKINDLKPNHYESKIESIEINFKKAQEYILAESSINKFFNEL